MNGKNRDQIFSTGYMEMSKIISRNVMHLSRYTPKCHFPFIWSNNLIPPSVIVDYLDTAQDS
jgi:hypothetical protein